MAQMRTARGKKHTADAVYTLRVDRKKLERLRTIAAADHRTVVQELRRMIDERIDRAEQEQAA